MSTVTATLADGRTVAVPRLTAEDWAIEASDLTTTDSLGDWFVADGENDELITGTRDDNSWCDHYRPGYDGKTVRVTNVSQARGFVQDAPMLSVRVCASRGCILDAMGWVERGTGEASVWINDEEKSIHTVPPLAGDVLIVSNPLSEDEVRPLLDKQGFVTVRLELDLDTFMAALAGGDEYDLAHERTVDFGVTNDSSLTPVSIDKNTITVEYATNIAAIL